jgi:excisionase family DNA binding protein
MQNANENLDRVIQRLESIEKLLLKLQEQSKPKETLTVNELAQLLGKSVETIYSYTSTKRIPHTKPLGTLLFLRSEIMQWLNTFKVKTIDEVEADADLSLIQMNKRKTG